ncbi:hypothetical protein HDE_04392 [Halotydeus destructor]|nr:hypothetical protein HDE_04392 [Halotydeus destructor]
MLSASSANLETEMSYISVWTKFSYLQYGPTYVTKGDDAIMKESGVVLGNPPFYSYREESKFNMYTKLSVHAAMEKLEKLGFTVSNFTQLNSGHPEAAHLMWTLHKMADRNSDSAQSTKLHFSRPSLPYSYSAYDD